MNFSKKHIVIIGGMGPQASIELHRRIIERAARLGAHNGDDFPQITHLSLPIDDFISDIHKTHKALSVLSVAMDHLYLWRKRSNSYSVQHCTSATA